MEGGGSSGGEGKREGREGREGQEGEAGWRVRRERQKEGAGGRGRREGQKGGAGRCRGRPKIVISTGVPSQWDPHSYTTTVHMFHKQPHHGAPTRIGKKQTQQRNNVKLN